MSVAIFRLIDFGTGDWADDWVGSERPVKGKIRHWAGTEAPVEVAPSFEIKGVSSAWDLFQATVYQWRVFSLETRYPTGFYNQGNDDAVLEFLRAIWGFFTAGLENQVTYEKRCVSETVAGPDAAQRFLPSPPRFDTNARPPAIVKACQAFVPDFGISITASDGPKTLGMISLRVRTLPPTAYLTELARRKSSFLEERRPQFDDDDDDVDEDPLAFDTIVLSLPTMAVESRYRHVGYITGLAVSRTARRRGVASTLVDFCGRKAAAWGADALCLHVNKLNVPPPVSLLRE